MELPAGVPAWAAWLILIVVVLALLAGFSWMTWLGRLFWKKLEGEEVTFERSGMEIRIVAPVKASIALQEACFRALQAAISGWRALRLPGNPDEQLKLVTVWFYPERKFPLSMTSKKPPHAYRADRTRAAGDPMPMFVIGLEHMGEVASTGEPLIHESLHQLCRLLPDYVPNSTHSEEHVWVHASGKDSVQHYASEIFKGQNSA